MPKPTIQMRCRKQYISPNSPEWSVLAARFHQNVKYREIVKILSFGGIVQIVRYPIYLIVTFRGLRMHCECVGDVR